jgi:integration host factor subunit alpha
MLFELIKESLQHGEDVMISGFGKFCVKEKHQRRGRNPQTGESMALPPRRVVSFHYSGALKEKINQSQK